jgi:Rad3-related DNA helicase
LNCFISESVARIEQLSQTAFSERSAIYEGGRLLVRGAAGTGKTVYALQLAINRAGTSGMPALYVCYSEHLANHIRESAWNSWGNLVITTPEELLVDLAGTESLKPFLDLEAEQQRSLSELYALLGEEPNKARARSYLDATKFGEQLIEAAAEAGARYSAVVVDEAQDFSDSLIDLFSLLVAPDGLFAAFVDPRQVTRRERGGAAWITPQSLRTATTQDLVKNYRNGDRIIDLVENEFSQLRYGRPVLGAPESIVDIREYSRASELPAVVQALIDELREADVHPSVLVSALGKEHLDELRRMGVNPVPVDDFKGLEDRAVVLVTGPSPNPLDPNREELYVGLTRANSYLGMVRRVRKPPIILKSTKGVSEKG